MKSATAKSSKVKGTTRSHDYKTAISREDAERLIRVIGDQRRVVLRIEADMNDRIAQIKEEYEQKATPEKKHIAELMTSVQNWAEQERNDLTNDGKTKTVKLATGEIVWCNRPPKVSLRSKDKILASLKILGLQRFVRTSVLCP